MADDKGYNGWTNYETWVTALWIDNDQWSYTEAREMVRQLAGIGEETQVWRIADGLKDWAEETFIDSAADVMSNANETQTGLACDLLRAAWSEVNWFEIAENWLSEITEEAEA